MLKAWRRHLKSCPHRIASYLKCKCPLWVMGILNGKFIRKSLDTRNLEKAAFDIRKMEVGKGSKISLKDACERFIAQGEANGLSVETLKKYKLLHRELQSYFGVVQLRSLTTDDLSKFRESWRMSNITARKKIERLRESGVTQQVTDSFSQQTHED